MEPTYRREACCAFTGHRPEKLRFCTADNARGHELLLDMLNHAVLGAVNKGYHHFITGMCRGMDLWAAQAVLRHRAAHPHIVLEAAVPHLGQEKKWTAEEQAVYRQVLDACDKKTVLGAHYFNGCMQHRNRYMVDHASLLIAAYDPAIPGGTKYTVGYALRKELTVINLLEKVNVVLSHGG